MKKGFTLIELLIVVAIIAILAAIAVPNFLEAQTRAKVSRAKADMRSMAVAVESYFVDNNTSWFDNNDGPRGPLTDAPPNIVNGWPRNFAVEPGHEGAPLDLKVGPDSTAPDTPVGTHSRWGQRTYAVWQRATTPISYITSVPTDAFSIAVPLSYERFAGGTGNRLTRFVVLSSVGPDKAMNTPGTNDLAAGVVGQYEYPNLNYDPTNGTISQGEVYRMAIPIDLAFAKTRFGENFVFSTGGDK